MKKKLLALFLCCVMVFSLVPVALTSAFATGDGFRIYSSNGTVAETVLLQMSKKMDLTAVAETGSGNYQWQIRVSGDVWANIVGTNGNTLELSYGLVANALDNDAAEIRCKLTNDVGNVSYSNIVTVQIQPDSTVRRAPAASPAVGTVISEAQPIGEPVIVPADAPSYYNAPAANSEPVVNDTPTDSGESNTDAEPAPVSNDEAADGNDDSVLPDVSVPVNDPAPVNDTPANNVPADSTVRRAPAGFRAPAAASNPASANDPAPVSDPPAEDTPTTYEILIKYQFTDGRQAAPSWSATVATGSTYTQDIQSPVVVGYTPSETVVRVNTSEAKTYTVTYQPAEVDFTVKHYQQNVSNDEYTLADTETKKDFTESAVGAGLAKTNYTGFYSLLYDTTTTIAADGSTLVKVYYDRYYYLMNFNLDGGYGVEPIYARFGAPISVDTPTKAGYNFSGWSLDGTTLASLPATMPAENRTYKAVWEAGSTAKVTVVFWGENADDEEYSYFRSMQVDATPGASYSYDGSTPTCPLAEHSHDSCTLQCTHTFHTFDCYITIYGCILTDRPANNLTDTGEGTYTYKTVSTTGNVTNIITHYYLNIDGKWYCAKDEYGNKDDTLPIIFYNSCKHTTHTDACYTCGLTKHKHGPACSRLWNFRESDTVTVAADGSTVVNVYYDRTEKTLTFKYNYSNSNYQSTEAITAKWGSNIAEQYKIIAEHAGSTFWSAQTSGEDPYTFYFGVMPQTSATYYNRRTTGGEGAMTYWGQDLNGGYTVKLFEVTGVGGGIYVSDEDRYEFRGFTYDSGTNNNSPCAGAKFYYTRNSYTLTFNDGYNDVNSENVLYEAPLSTYSSYVPAVPSAYESGSVTFGGWYLNPECTGAEYKLDDHTMPADNVLLYAKWVPVSHTVEFYLDRAALNAGTKLSTHSDITVRHGSKADPTPANPTNGSYTFVGWFYMENGVEKAFDFANMPVTKDLQVYGKWNSNVLKEYTIYYKIQGTDTEIADPTTGSGLAGITKTFEAKGGAELYAGYQEGYFPVTKSHSLTLDIENDANNVYTFRYVQKEAVPYTVKYLDKETGEPLAGVPEKTVSDNRKAVVTETFVPVSGMLPDAYQKRLVVSDEEGAVNEIIFYYTEDTTHAYYKITHYTENLAKDAQGNTTWTEYASSQAVGDIGTTYSADPMTIPGFTYSTVEGTVTSGKLTANGLELKLYYTRNSYPYQVRYLEQGTGKQLADPKNDTGKYGQVVSESAIDIANYTAVDPTSQTLNIRIEETAALNIITFYYTEQEVTINYQVVGPTGASNFGSVSPTSETLKVLSGTAQGSTPAANSGFRFVGWYTDEACTTPVTAGWVDANNKLTPVKAASAAWTAATYYAKFEYDVADLTITKQGWENIDENQSFLFDVTGPDGYSQRVVIKGNGSVTIKGLKIGEYTVTEVTSWSWRYTANSNSQSIELKPAVTNAVTFVNTRSNHKWLGGDAYSQNIFGN